RAEPELDRFPTARLSRDPESSAGDQEPVGPHGRETGQGARWTGSGPRAAEARLEGASPNPAFPEPAGPDGNDRQVPCEGRHYFDSAAWPRRSRQDTTGARLRAAAPG